MRHEIPLWILDPFLYLEANGRRAVLTTALEEGRLLSELPEIERILPEHLGRDRLLATECSTAEVELELCVRAVRHLDIRRAIVPPDFPVALADRLRARDISVAPSTEPFTDRRRHKTRAELEGIRRASAAAVAGIAHAADLLRRASIKAGLLHLANRTLTAEIVRAEIRQVCARAGATCPQDIMIKPMGPNPPIGHASGAGELPADVPILIDVFPRDDRSGCLADATRTFVRGEVSTAIGALYQTVLEAKQRVCAAVHAGASAGQLYEAACDVFEAAGHPTQRTKVAGQPLRHGFYHGLGHGVGLDVHEAPRLRWRAREILLAGEILALEPGTVVPEIGGGRIEDLIIVTDRGLECLTDGLSSGLHP